MSERSNRGNSSARNRGQQGSKSRSKANKGQDEQLHTFINPDNGATVIGTMRQFKAADGLRDQGFEDRGVVTDPDFVEGETLTEDAHEDPMTHVLDEDDPLVTDD